MKIKSKLAQVFLSAALAAFAFPAVADNACYAPAQMRAEQLLRLHSELMVITAICHQGSAGQPLPDAYAFFTKKNIGILRTAEQTMIAHYRATAKGDAIGRLDRLRTLLANEFALKSASMSSPKFCAAYRDKVIRFTAATPADIENEAQLMEASSHAYASRCGAQKGR